MPKINREEYEVLKDLDDKYKWIARDEDRGLYAFTKKPVKKDGPLSYWRDAEPYDEIHLFQFIQWEDEEPYNIAELIEEYESEETEVKKDLEWLKDEVNRITNEYASENIFANYTRYMISDIKDAINQLDKPEVLSDKWIDEHKVARVNDLRKMTMSDVVLVESLQNLLVPKGEQPKITESDALNKIAKSYPLTPNDIPWILDRYVANVLVEQPALPVIPKFVADTLEENTFADLPTAFEELFSANAGNYYGEDVCKWIVSNEETFARAWLDGYEVAEEREQKYYVDLETAAYVAKWDGNGQVDIYTDGISGSDEFEFYLTEQEIKDYDERFWPFAVKAEELEE